MYGVGYDWAQQYSVSSGDFVGSLPVGMQSRGNTDLPYWSSQNMYVYKEVWVHSTSRWLWLLEDLIGRQDVLKPAQFAVSSTTAGNIVTIRVETNDTSVQSFTFRAHGLTIDQPTKTVSRGTIEWRARRTSNDDWVGVVIPGDDLTHRREISSWNQALPRTQ
jgi:hypothetical protein